MNTSEKLRLSHALDRMRSVCVTRLRSMRQRIDALSIGEVGDPVDLALDHISRGTEQMLLELEWRHLQSVSAAQRRLCAGEHGTCSACGRAIRRRRLAALPEASLCLSCAARREAQRNN